MKRFLLVLITIAFVGSSMSGCMYSAIAVAGDKVIVAKSIMGGMGSALYVCQLTPDGLADCRENESP
jgi:hypothetical protein